MARVRAPWALPSLPSTPPWARGGFLQPAVPPVCVCAAYQIKRLVCKGEMAGREKGAKPLSAAQPRLSTKKKLGLPGCEAMRLRY